MNASAQVRCYHCNEPVPPNEKRVVTVDGNPRPVCCAGCEAVANLILDAGLKDFYRFRSETSAKVDKLAPESHWLAFDENAVLDNYAPLDAEGFREIRLQLDDIRCAACGWLIEQTLADDNAICDIQLNVVNGRATLRWDANAVRLSELLAHLDRLGFHPHPLRPDDNEQQASHERRRYLKRIAIAGLGMMQVMMYAVAMYIGAIDTSGEGMDTGVWHFLRGVSLLIATPVVFYAAAPFFKGAWRDVTHRRAGMDVPVAIAIGAAYAASVWHTLLGRGEVYFDSVSMFVFFLLIGRFLEFNARHQVAAAGSAMAASLPATVTLKEGNTTRSLPLAQLAKDQVVIVSQGSVVPADGELLDAAAALDESLLTGESQTVRKRAGDLLAAGAVNHGKPLTLRVTRTGRDTLLSGITRLLEKAQASRPRMARMADRIAQYFVGIVLVLASITFIAWEFLDPARAFEITLAVLVVTCPCALALAVPVALTTATGAIAREGVLAVNTDAFEVLDGVTDVVFDKTGTLTEGQPHICRRVVTGVLPESTCLALARGLEAAANHPLARAFATLDADEAAFTDIEQVAGHGMSGMHEGHRYRIGTPAYALQDDNAAITPPGMDGSWIVLADDDGPLAWFALEDRLRPEARAVVHGLQRRGLRVHLLSGDSEAAVTAVAKELGISNVAFRQQPQDKLDAIRRIQESGGRVMMLGDGLNDAPVLGGADVSVAMSRGATLAQAGADFVLTGPLTALTALLRHGMKTRRVIRQNLAWAAGYNLVALPLAAAGLVAPWMAAIGMSASSLLVTLNALRLRQVNASNTPGSHAGKQVQGQSRVLPGAG
ncbi:MAG: heavy metal translocating P-type ATPase [Gammaproteobacteria bacterium]|nr:heavy metal translocating P-type ATPase [Gammaproteobacteria bacterium]